MSHPFDELRRRTDADRETHNDEMREGSLVNRLLVRTYGATAARRRRDLLELSMERTGQHRMTFALFNELFPNYPVLLAFNRLGGIKLHADSRMMLASLIKTFAKTPVHQYFDDWLPTAQSMANGRNVGMVFGRRGFKYGMIIHDGGLDFSRHLDTVISFKGGSRQTPVLLGTQWFDTFVDAIAERNRELA